MSDQPGPVRRWVLAARIRTLPAALVPVVVGASLAHRAGGHARINPLNVALAGLVSLALQIGTNFANDYSDGVKGTDDNRVGPFRLTASRLVPAKRVMAMAIAVFAVAGLLGLVLAARVSWWYLPIGATAIVAGWLYTGGPKPYGYLGLGELFVFIYFGLVATAGTAYAQGVSLGSRVWVESVAVGLSAVCILEANNIRDIDGDRVAGKKTLAARVGRSLAGRAFVATVSVVVVLVFVAGVRSSVWVSSLAVAAVATAYLSSIKLAVSDQAGRALLPMLAHSARAELVVGVGLLAVNLFN
jgi:1,4-dihydroxy-2-naphthoate octaprenyltransferase